MSGPDPWDSDYELEDTPEEEKEPPKEPVKSSKSSKSSKASKSKKKKTKNKAVTEEKTEEKEKAASTLNKKKYAKFAKNVEMIDKEYLVENKYIHKRDSLMITKGGQLICNQWNPTTHPKGGVIRIQCDKDIYIEKDGKITASARGWSGKYGYGQGQKLRHYDIFGGASYGSKGSLLYDFNTKTELKAGTKYGEPQLIKLYPGTGNKYLCGGGIIELIAENVINDGLILNNGHGGCTGGCIFICCRRFVNNGKILAKGGNKTSFCGQGGMGRIAIYTDEYENNGTITPKPYRHSFEPAKKKVAAKKKKAKTAGKKKKTGKKKGTASKKKKDEAEDDEKDEQKAEEKTNDAEAAQPAAPKKSVYEYALNEIVNKREVIKMKVLFEKKFALRVEEEKKVDAEKQKQEKEISKAVDEIVKMLLKYEEKITNPEKEIFAPLKISKEMQALLDTQMGMEIMEKNRKLYEKTSHRDHMIIDRLITELKFLRLLASISLFEFTAQYKMSIDLFDLNAMATMRYTNGRSEPFEDILPRVLWRFNYEYMDKRGKIKKQKSDFKFREKSLESKIVVWDFANHGIVQKYEMSVKVDRTSDKYVSIFKNDMFSIQKSVNVALHYLMKHDDIHRCGFLRVEHTGRLYPREWYSDTKEGGQIVIECHDLVNYGAIDTNLKGKYGKYGSGAGKLREDKKKKKSGKRDSKLKLDDNYYFGAKYTGKPKLSTLVLGCGIVGRKYFKGGGAVDLYVKDHFINYGNITANGALSSSGGSICIVCKLFINYGTLSCLGGKQIAEKSGKGEDGRIAIYAKIFENYGTILPAANVYFGDFEEGKKAFMKRHAPK